MSAGSTTLLRRHYRPFAAVILLLAAFNGLFNLNREYVAEWDESLYATSAWEMLRSRQWVATTFDGNVDYYNTKPPLFVWSLAAAFWLFGPGLWSLRLPSVICAWTTVALLQWWARRRIGEAPALFASVVLATLFSFWSIHSGRSAATDAPFTLVVLLTVIALDLASQRGRRIVWLGPLLAAAFMLRGMALLLPGALIALVVARQRPRPPASALAGAAAFSLIPIATWAIARYRFDGYRFLFPLVTYDFVTRASTSIEGHDTSVFFYLDILQKYHYEWLLASVGSLWLMRPWQQRETAPMDSGLRALLLTWGAVTLLVPTLMQTRLAWYLNPFYPLFALAVGMLFTRSLANWHAVSVRSRWGWVAICVLALGLAEGKLLYTSLARRSLSRSNQALLFAERGRFQGRRVFVLENPRSARFVGEAITGADVRSVASVQDFARSARVGDFVIARGRCPEPALASVNTTATFSVCQMR